MKKLLLLLTSFILCYTSNTAQAENYKGYTYKDCGYVYSELTVPTSVSKDINKKEDKKLDNENLKKGVSSRINVLGLVELGNSGIMEAASKGGIKKIHYVETRNHKVFIPLGFIPIYFNEQQTIVYGE